MLKVGIAKIDITPRLGTPLAGAFRLRESTHIVQRLHARALVLEQNGQRYAILAADLLGFHPGLVARLQRRGIRLLLCNASHNHSGPNVCREFQPDETPRARQRRLTYEKQLERKLCRVLANAAARLRPVTLQFSSGKAYFGINRRRKVNGEMRMLPNPRGFHDKTVTVFRFAAPTGKTVAVLFSYACHPTTTYDRELGTDYPGVAMQWLERRTGGTALFVQGACAEIRPKMTTPDGRSWRRATQADVRREGRELGREVWRVLHGQMRTLQPQLSSRSSAIVLPFDRLPTAADVRAFRHPHLTEPLVRAWKRTMLRAIKHRRLPKGLPMPLALLRLAPDHAILAVGHEFCNAYVPKIQRLAGDTRITLLSYTNDYHAYVPTRKVRLEGGYEGDWSFYSYLLPAKFHPSVERVILSACRKLLTRVSP